MLQLVTSDFARVPGVDRHLIHLPHNLTPQLSCIPEALLVIRLYEAGLTVTLSQPRSLEIRCSCEEVATTYAKARLQR
jgi:hypothetical protein